VKFGDEFLELYVVMCNTISKPIRIKIIKLIGRRKLNVSQIQKELDVSMSNISNHLTDLYRQGILSREKKGNFTYYSLADSELLDGIDYMQKIIRKITKKRSSIKPII
jgi:DNA-binding transcriptional ArsR family regulator